MKQKKEYLEKIYEKFSEDIKPTDEMRKIYRSFSDKITNLKDKLPKEELKEFEIVEDLFSEISYLEVKQAFLKGFTVAQNINSESLN